MKTSQFPSSEMGVSPEKNISTKLLELRENVSEQVQNMNTLLHPDIPSQDVLDIILNSMNGHRLLLHPNSMSSSYKILETAEATMLNVVTTVKYAWVDVDTGECYDAGEFTGTATSEFGEQPFEDPSGKAMDGAEWSFFVSFFGLPVNDENEE